MDDAERRPGPEPPRIPTPADPDCRSIVIIPVRDEAENLPAALQALAGQVTVGGRPFPRSHFEVIVLANNCRDDSAALARRFGRQHPDLALRVVEADFPPRRPTSGRRGNG